MADLKERKDMVQMTFENNEIYDVKGLCSVFRYLKHFEKLESLNFRCNKNFDEMLIKALGEGISLKKELRVSTSFYLTVYRRLTWVRMISLMKALRFWEMLSKLMSVFTCYSWILTALLKRGVTGWRSVLKTSKI